MINKTHFIIAVSVFVLSCKTTTYKLQGLYKAETKDVNDVTKTLEGESYLYFENDSSYYHIFKDEESEIHFYNKGTVRHLNSQQILIKYPTASSFEINNVVEISDRNFPKDSLRIIIQYNGMALSRSGGTMQFFINGKPQNIKHHSFTNEVLTFKQPEDSLTDIQIYVYPLPLLISNRYEIKTKGINTILLNIHLYETINYKPVSYCNSHLEYIQNCNLTTLSNTSKKNLESCFISDTLTFENKNTIINNGVLFRKIQMSKIPKSSIDTTVLHRLKLKYR